MFFASISLALSVFLFVTSWDGGRLLTNARALWKDVKPAIDKINAEKPPGADVQWSRLRDRVEELRDRITTGDQGALYYLDNLKRDMELMRDYTTDQSSKWFEEATTTLAQARQDLQKNGPAAADRIKKLADQLKTMAAQVRKTKTPEPEGSRE